MSDISVQLRVTSVRSRGIFGGAIFAGRTEDGQGSQFKRVIVPIRDSHFLDQTLVYAAVTRGVDQVVLVGDEKAALRAITAPASASKRHILLLQMLTSDVPCHS